MGYDERSAARTARLVSIIVLYIAYEKEKEMNESLLSKNDQWLFIDNMLFIARVKWKNASGKVTADIFRNLDSYKNNDVFIKNAVYYD